MLDDFPGRTGQMLVADVVSHEHDLRSALGLPGARDGAGVRVALDFLVPVFMGTGTDALGLAPLEVRAGGQSWVVGSRRAATGDLESWRDALIPDGDVAGAPVEPEGSLSAAPFELMRAVAGRRSSPQIRALDWSVDPDPYLPVFGFGPFRPRTTDLVE
jgi:hypothetical protein